MQAAADSTSNPASTRASAVGGNASSLLLGRPLSLGNLLIQRDSVQSKTHSIASKRSYDVLSPVSPAFPRSSANQAGPQLHQYATVDPAALHAVGGQPISSTSSHPSASRNPAAGLTSPTGSIHSIASTSTTSTTTAVFPSTARSVLLPQNGHGVRTRVNILPASAAVAANKAGSGLSAAASKDRRASLALQRPVSPANTAVRSASPQPYLVQSQGSSRATGMTNLGWGQVKPPPRVQSASLSHTYTSHMQDRSTTSSPVPQNAAQLDDRRTVSDSTGASPIASSSTAEYRFPVAARHHHEDNRTFTYGSSSAFASVRAAPSRSAVQATGSAEASDFGSLTAHPSTSISADALLFSASPLPALSNTTSRDYYPTQTGINGHGHSVSATPPAADGSRQHPQYHRIHTADELYTASPFELSSDGTLTRPNAPFTSHSAKPSRTHLANLPKSLIPGGYDFSPTSVSTHGSHHYPRHHQPSASTSAFAFARDRSASVPRTVSSIGDDSGRSTVDHHREDHRMPAVPEVDATFVTAKQTLESASMRTNKGDDSGHAHLVSAFSNSSHATSSRQSTEEENASSMLSHDVVAPLISPIPPKLDLDFGNSSGFSLDFGSDFGGSLGLSFGGGGGSRKGSNFGLTFGDFGSSMPLSKASGLTAPEINNKENTAGTGDDARNAKSTMSSFLSLQDSTLSTDADVSLFLTDNAVDLPPLSANSDSTLQDLRRPNGQAESTTTNAVKPQEPPILVDKPVDSQQIPEVSFLKSSASLSPSAVGTAPAHQSTLQSDNSVRSESPASIISTNSFSRPLSSLSTRDLSISDIGFTRKRLLENPAYKGDYTSSDDSKRTTLSSGEHIHVKTANNPSLANRPTQGFQQNTNARASFNKSLPPVPPKSPDQARTFLTSAAETSPSQPSSLETASQLHVAKSHEQIGLGLPRDALGAGRRSYSEHTQSYNEQRPSSSYVRQNSDYTGSRGEGKSTVSSASTVERPLSQVSGADNASVHSAASSTYTSQDVTCNFSAPTVPDVTRAYRPSADCEQGIRQGRSETARLRSNTVDHFQGIKNAFDKDRTPMQDIPLAKLARPKMNIRNAWPGGELRKRDAVTDKVLETVTAKLEVWLTRHPERLMTAEEAKLHNSLGSFGPTDANEARESSKQQSIARIPPPSERVSDSRLGASQLRATQESDDRLPIRRALNDEANNVSGPIAARLDKERQADTDPQKAHVGEFQGRQDKDRTLHQPSPSLQQATQPDLSSLSTVPSSLPALTNSSSLTAATLSTSSASTSKTSEPVRTPLTAVASSPSLDPAFATTVPLKILPKSRSVTPAKTTKLPSLGGEQPWSQNWTGINEALISYRSALKQEMQDRASLSQNGLVPAFRKEEHLVLLYGRVLSNKQKEVLLDWVDVLFEDLQGAPPNRGACLDGIAIIIESRLMNYFAFAKGTEGFSRYEQTIASLVAFAVGKLNGKAIFANTLSFAGKMLASAFWNLEGVGSKLLRLLPAVKKQHIARIYADAGSEKCPGKFPPHLGGLVFDKSPVDYMKAFPPVRGDVKDTYLYKATFQGGTPKQASADPEQATVNDALEIHIEMTGNWLIRWTATDSDLPFAFMRAYHRQLSNYLPLYQPGCSDALTVAQLVKAPGYIFVAATLLEVCDALIHRKLRSVTTMAPSNAGVNANESANLAAGQKPKSLEIVSKRVIQTIFEIVGGSLQAETPQLSPVAFTSAALRHNFGSSVSMWLRAITKKTSMWDTRGIFALLDLIEGLMYNVCCPPYEEGQEEEDDVWIPSETGLKLFDTKFILSFIKTILSKADNTTCLLRTISFLYTEFQSFTLREEDRDELCVRVILDAEVFNRLFLYYNVGVRGYFLRLLVYRLARLGSSDDGKPASRDAGIIAILRLFEYSEIDPLDDDGWDSDISDDFRPRPKRSTVCSTWGVRNKPWTLDLAQIGREDSSESDGEEGTKDAVERVQSQPSETSEDREKATFPQQPVEPQNPDTIIGQAARRLSSTSSLDRLPPASSRHRNANDAKKGNVAKSALKVWNALTQRKAAAVANSDSKKKAGSMMPMSEPNNGHQAVAVEKTPTSDQAGLSGITITSSSKDARRRNSSESKTSKGQEDQKTFPTQVSSTQENFSKTQAEASENKANVLTIELSAPRLRKQSSRKSIRRGAASQTTLVNGKLATSAVSPRSRRSSLYSFDLDVETPRSDSFDLPRSPLHGTGNGIVQSGSASPAPGSRSGVLSLSPVAFSALLDGALNFDNLDADGHSAERSGDRLNPGEHKRHKSISSARNRSRPVSVASDRTGPSPRVSKRFSKRASILPPQALDLLKESPSEPVPKIPEQYKSPTSCTNAGSAMASNPRPPSPEPYDRKLQPYAIRGLREYEDCLDEWELFVHRVKEEEGIDGRELAALIPRLQCAWPSTWED